MVNTALFTVGSIAGQFVIGLAAGAVLPADASRSAACCASLLLLPWLIPLIVSSATWRSILEQDNGILNRSRWTPSGASTTRCRG